MSRKNNRRSRTRDHVPNQRLRFNQERYVTLNQNHLTDLAAALRAVRMASPLSAATPRVYQKRISAPVRPTVLTPPTEHKIWQPSAPVNQVIKKSVCEHRAERKEVMFALNHAGKGGQRPAKWTKNSFKRCK